ncbi:MAG: toll/interleukin-1 receptor domain-containing protein [Parvularculaceae bacterium]
MTDVFITFAAEDRGKAQAIARAIEDAGLTVWWDRRPTERAVLEDELERALAEAKAVIALWSAHAAATDWVLKEAEAAKRAGTIVNVSLDDAPAPKAFSRPAAYELREWSGDADAAPVARLVSDVRGQVDHRRRAAAPRTVDDAAGRRAAIFAGFLVFAAIVGFAFGGAEPFASAWRGGEDRAAIARAKEFAARVSGAPFDAVREARARVASTGDASAKLGDEFGETRDDAALAHSAAFATAPAARDVAAGERLVFELSSERLIEVSADGAFDGAGVLAGPGAAHEFRMSWPAGAEIELDLEASEYGDVSWELFDPDGAPIASEPAKPDVDLVSYRAPMTGVFVLRVAGSRRAAQIRGAHVHGARVQGGSVQGADDVQGADPGADEPTTVGYDLKILTR